MELLGEVLIQAAIAPVFWIVTALAVLLFRILRKRSRNRLAWATLIGAPSVALLSLMCGTHFDLNDLLFNFASPLTHKVRLYPVECKGKVARGNLCCGKLDKPLNPTTFTVSVMSEQVSRSTIGGFDGPLHNCSVQSYLNWQCATYWDESRTNEVDAGGAASTDWYLMSEGRFSESFSVDPDARKQKQLEAMRNYVWVDAMEWWLGHRRGYFETHKGIWDSKEPNRYERAADDGMCRASSLAK